MRRLPSPQILLFLAVVLLTGALVLGMAVRLSLQDRALAERNREAARRLAVADLGQKLLAHLERVRIQELRAPGTADDAHVVLRARLRNGRVVLPSDGVENPAGPSDPAYERALARAQRLESAGEPARAAERYRAAVRLAPTPAAAALATLGLARSLEGTGDLAGARTEYATILEVGAGVRDEQGVRVALYAADRLSGTGAQGRRSALEHIERILGDPGALGPLEAYLVRDLMLELAAGAGEGATETGHAGLVEAAEEAAARSDQTLVLQRDAPALFRLARRGDAPDPLWVPFGEPLWLVSVPPETGDAEGVLLAVDARAALAAALDGDPRGDVDPASVRLGTGEGDPLHASIPGLRASMPHPDVAGGSPGSAVLLLLAPLVLGATALTAWLLWRDVRREVAAVRMRSQFVSSVSHELKTPLTAIRMFAETLQRGAGDDPERRRTHLDTIVGETERLTRLINNVLDFSRLEEGGRSYRMEPVRLEDVARDARRAMAYPLAQGGYTLAVDADDAVTVRADRDAILQAILNLLANALKFSGEARDIEMRVWRHNGDALVSVRDHGIGIRPEDQGRIFEEFFRAEEAERLGITGTGLGLPLVRHVARAHGGDVEVESRPGVGSSFTLRLPLEADP